MKVVALLSLLPLAEWCAARFPVTPISELRKSIAATQKASLLKRDVDPTLLYPARYLDVPVDHFHNETKYAPHSNGTFKLRYWFDDSYYKPGGPVFVLGGGEVDASERLPYMQKGILYQLSKATGGLSVVLEHRYYGTSFPTPDLSTENLRFLTTDQAMADSAYFAEHVVFKGHESKPLSPKDTPWIAYGGSYAGAFTAILRTLYPDVYFGGISSSGVNEAIWDYWRYYEAARLYGPQDCVRDTQVMTDVVDKILIGHKGSSEVAKLKTLFGLQDIQYDNDFANAIAQGIAGWQSLNWDPAVSSPGFFQYCDALSNKSVTYPTTNSLKPQIQHVLQVAGYGAKSNLTTVLQNYVGYVNSTIVQPCISGGQTTDECYTTHNATFFQQDGLDTFNARSWPYQYCSQWGLLQTGSGVPKNQLPLISRTIDLDYSSIVCRDSFNITSPPDTQAITKYGGWNISYPRLAIIDGEQDPWRDATPHSLQAPNPNRVSTTDEPFILIQGAIHHWDENALFPNQTTATLPPKPVADTQKAEVAFVKEWLKEWKPKAQPYKLH